MKPGKTLFALALAALVLAGCNDDEDGNADSAGRDAVVQSPQDEVARPITWRASFDAAVGTVGLVFSGPVSNMTLGDVDVARVTGAATALNLTGEGTRWTLEVAVESSGLVAVSVAGTGVDGDPVEVEVFTPAAWEVSVNDGANTTVLHIEFDSAVSRLVLDDIGIADGTGSVATWILTGGGARWALPVAVTRAGTITVSVKGRGIKGGTVEVEVGGAPFPEGWALVSGGGHSLAIGTDGSLWAWGGNSEGQIGDGTSGWDVNRDFPVRIGTDYDCAHVSACPGRSVAIRTDGSLWEWGQTGLERHLVPTRVGTDYDWVSVSTGTALSIPQSVATKADGSLWEGEMFADDPAQMRAERADDVGAASPSTRSWRSADTIGWHVSGGWRAFVTAAIGTDGSLWRWSRHESAMDGGTDLSPPTELGADRDWATVSLGGGNIMAIKTDGSLWAWSGWGLDATPTRIAFDEEETADE